MNDYPKFPDAMDVFITWVQAGLGAAEKVSHRVESQPRFVQITRTGGPAARFTDHPMLTVNVYDTDLQAAFGFAADVRQIISNARGRRIMDGVDCKGINEFSGPADDPDLSHGSARVSWTFAAVLRPV